MTKLPAYLLWHQALNFMVTGEPRDTNPELLDMEHTYAAAFGEPGPVYCMNLERARDQLMDRLATGADVAIGQKREAIGVNGYTTESFPSPIEPTAWINLEIDDKTSDATISRLEASIPGQGYAKVRLRRETVFAAREAVLAEHRAEQTELIGLLAPMVPAPEQPAPSAGESPRERTKRLERKAVEYLDAQATAALDSGDLLDGADTMLRNMPGSATEKVVRERFRQLHKEAQAKHGVGARGRGRSAR